VSRSLVTRGLAVGHLLGALGIVAFWVAFYAGVAIPAELAKKIPSFDAYLGFERAFVLPDLLTAAVMSFAALNLLVDPECPRYRSMLVAASGALVFLTLLDTSYALKNGLYSLGHRFSMEILAVPLVGVLGLATIAWLVLSTERRPSLR
jgi:hypothetical protein